MESETPAQKVGERIYIGGLNPPRLSARDILRRLKSLDRIKIESSSIADDDEESDSEYIDTTSKPYLHITAISKDDSVSALSILHKHYHNVKWKGCKLVVEPAKPHFLERLAQERQEIKAKKAEINTPTMVTEEPQVEETRIPRRLRVRKKFGDTAVHIDTKPWSVDTWSRFDKALTKLKQREEKHQANTIASKNSKDEPIPGPLMHRAVHIRFETDIHATLKNLDRREDKNDNQNSGMISSSDSSSSSESDSDSESSDESLVDNSGEPATKQTPEKYEWSDDDSDSDDSEAANNSANKRQQIQSENNRKEETYHWSTDEDSDQDDYQKMNSSFPSKDKRQLRPVSGTQEFAAGFDEDFDENPQTEDDEHFDPIHRTEDDNDLVGDVASNLNILSSIFPEMANTRPVKPDSEPNSKVDNESTTSSADEKKNKPSMGIMPRFDPTAKSSEQYIVQNEDKEENDSGDQDETSDNEEMDDTDDAKTENDTRQKLPNVSTVYEQDKLENVFRDARDAWKQDDNNAAATSGTANPNAPEKSSAFSFGFNLGDNDKSEASNEKTSESQSAGFSFGFNLPDPDPKEEKATSTIQDDSATENRDVTNMQTEALSSSANDVTTGNDSDEEDPDVDSKRQKGLKLPDQDLQKYVDNFFGCNNGIHIMQNPDEFMNDEKEKAEWNNERQTLTLDWKRKRKYAITRIQKRMKVRRR